MEWFRGSKPIRKDSKYDVRDEGRSHKLVIDSVDSDDVMEYRAEYLHLETRAKLAVEGQFPFLLLSSLITMTLAEIEICKHVCTKKKKIFELCFD